MTKKKHWKDEIFHSDYPLTQDADGQWIQGVWRRFKLLSYDGNKYGHVLCLDEPGGTHEFKIGYLRRDPANERSFLRYQEILYIAAGTKKHVRVRQDKKTSYDVHDLDSNGLSFQNHHPVNTLKDAMRVVRRIGGRVMIVRERQYVGGWDSEPFREFGPVTQRWTYRKNTGKPGPRVREYERT